MAVTTHRKIANPRRTTLAHLNDARDITERPVERSEQPVTWPRRTANPRRTVLDTAPGERGTDA